MRPPSVSVPAVSVPPGLKIEPLPIVAVPVIVPAPERVVEEPLTVTAPVPVADPEALETLSVPAETVVPPVKVFPVPESSSTPGPVLVKAPA